MFSSRYTKVTLGVIKSHCSSYVKSVIWVRRELNTFLICDGSNDQILYMVADAFSLAASVSVSVDVSAAKHALSSSMVSLAEDSAADLRSSFSLFPRQMLGVVGYKCLPDCSAAKSSSQSPAIAHIAKASLRMLMSLGLKVFLPLCKHRHDARTFSTL